MVSVNIRSPHVDSIIYKTRTTITFTKLSEIKMGQPITLSGYIYDAYGRPVTQKSIIFTISGVYLGQASSDQKGFFQREFKRVLSAGTYAIGATFNGTHFLELTTTSATLKVLPSDAQIQVVPPVAGITFDLNGQQFVSGDDGFAYVNINSPGQYRLRILLDQYHNPSLQVEFGRWLDETRLPYIDIQIPTAKVIQVGLNLYQQVGQSFVDLDGYPVDPQRVAEFSIRSAQGDVFDFNNGQPRWIPASRVTRLVDGLRATPLLYSVNSVTVDGSNVVNQAQQKFFAHPDAIWSISLQLYSMHISARDALFGFPVGKSVNVEFPDGHIGNYPINRAGEVDIHSLARGNYFTKLVGANGLSFRTPVALSRSQTITTKVITYLDLAIVGVLGALVALGLLFYGRPMLLLSLLRKNGHASQDVAIALAEQDESHLPDKKELQPGNEFVRWS
jgi:hypothetical protein